MPIWKRVELLNRKNLENIKMDELKERMARQLDLLHEECQRVKMFVNENGFDCTTAPFVIVKNYRDALKKHMAVLRENLADF